MLPYKSDHANAKGALGTRLVAPLAPMAARSERQSQGHSDGVDSFLARVMAYCKRAPANTSERT